MINTGMQSTIERVPLDLLREPLVWFFAEHYRHRDVCSRLLVMARTVVQEPDALEEIHDFLDYDLAVHVIDEEDDLFPLMRRRCEPDDHIEGVLGMLSGEHASDLQLASAVKSLVAKAMADGRGLAAYADAWAVIEPFCVSQKRHIAVENAVVLPIARLRLTASDLRGLGQRLAARRGLPDPFVQAS